MGLVRLFLALVVVCDHWRAAVLAPLGKADGITDFYKLGMNSGYAVFFFYIISGFLIAFTLSRNYARGPTGARDFYERRLVRIFSLYWPLVTAALAVVPGAWAAFASSGTLQQFSALFLIGMDWQLAAGVPLNEVTVRGLPQAWTLGAELTFYVAAPLLVRSWKAVATLLVVSLGFRLGFVFLNGPALHLQWTYTFPLSTFCFFMLGFLACLKAQRWPALASPWLGWPLLASSAAAMLWGGNFADFDGTRFWSSTALFTLALPGLFSATKSSRWMNALGDLSYPVYLIHFLPIASGYGSGLDSLATVIGGPAWYASTAIYAVLTVGAAAAVHRLLEIPTAALMRRVLNRRPPVARVVG